MRAVGHRFVAGLLGSRGGLVFGEQIIVVHAEPGCFRRLPELECLQIIGRKRWTTFWGLIGPIDSIRDVHQYLLSLEEA